MHSAKTGYADRRGCGISEKMRDLPSPGQRLEGAAA
jgi:hypothetical protein